LYSQNTTCTTAANGTGLTENRYVVDASEMYEKGFFVSDLGQTGGRVSKVRAFPRNILVSVEYQVSLPINIENVIVSLFGLFLK
jgi:hypothetical protein